MDFEESLELEEHLNSIKDLVEQLIYLWENDSLYPDAESIFEDLKQLLCLE